MLGRFFQGRYLFLDLDIGTEDQTIIGQGYNTVLDIEAASGTTPASTPVAMASNLPAMAFTCLYPSSDGLQPN